MPQSLLLALLALLRLLGGVSALRPAFNLLGLSRRLGWRFLSGISVCSQKSTATQSKAGNMRDEGREEEREKEKRGCLPKGRFGFERTLDALRGDPAKEVDVNQLVGEDSLGNHEGLEEEWLNQLELVHDEAGNGEAGEDLLHRLADFLTVVLLGRDGPVLPPTCHFIIFISESD